MNGNVQQHMVGRQIFELTVASETEALACRERLDRFCRTALGPLLDELLSRVTGPETVVVIDRLELDLGTLSLADLEEELADRLREALAGSLAASEEIATGPPAEKRLEKLGNGRGIAAPRPPAPDGARPVAAAERSAELLMIFLRTGMLPWWGSASELPELAAALEALSAEAGRSPTARERLHALVAARRSRSRLVAQFGEAAAAKAGAVLLGWPEATLFDLVAEGAALLAAGLVRRAAQVPMRERLWQALLAAAATVPAPPVDTAAIAGRLAEELTALLPREADDLKKALAAASTHPARTGEHRPHAALWQQVSQILAQRQDGSGRTPTAIEKGSAAPAITSPTPLAEPPVPGTGEGRQPPYRQHAAEPATAPGRGLKEDRNILESKKITHKNPNEHEPIEAAFDLDPATGIGVGVDNAGLVLVWPFLGSFFERLDLFDNRAFRSPAAAGRAVLILQALATGEAAAPEYRLVLNKLLCGVALDEPVPAAVELSRQERDECETLLTTVIGHWQALKSTSPDGLRQAFLRREGILRRQEEGHWRLAIERCGHDVLLDRLPWGLSVIKLSWMEEPLYVEW